MALPTAQPVSRTTNSAPPGRADRQRQTFFFGAYEGQRERVTSDFLLGVPTPAQIAAAEAYAGGAGAVNPALINLISKYYPSPTNIDPSTGNGTAQVAVPDKSDLNSFIIKIDHQINDRNTLTGRYAYSGGNQRYPLGGPPMAAARAYRILRSFRQRGCRLSRSACSPRFPPAN